MRSLTERKIGLALSGGGFRAATFHLGTLKRLAEDRLFEQVSFISSVSGGSLVVALIYSLSGNKWPTSEEFLRSIYPRALRCFEETNLEKDIVLGLFRPDIWWRFGLAALTARALEKRWKIKCSLKDIPSSPRWIINATTYETGKNFRFMHKRMGDYLLNYAAHPDLPVSVAIASSAGFPILIGPYILRTNRYDWFKYEDGSNEKMIPASVPFKKIHLWDGGVYDNLGLEALFKTNRSEFRDGFDFLIVSDGSLPIGISTSRLHLSRAHRLVDIAAAQARNLMVRNLMRHFTGNPYSGVFFQIGVSSELIVGYSPRRSELKSVDLTKYLDRELCMQNAKIPSRLSPMPEDHSALLARHGWEVAHVTMSSFCPDYFSL